MGMSLADDYKECDWWFHSVSLIVPLFSDALAAMGCGNAHREVHCKEHEDGPEATSYRTIHKGN